MIGLLSVCVSGIKGYSLNGGGGGGDWTAFCSKSSLISIMVCRMPGVTLPWIKRVRPPLISVLPPWAGTATT